MTGLIRDRSRYFSSLPPRVESPFSGVEPLSSVTRHHHGSQIHYHRKLIRQTLERHVAGTRPCDQLSCSESTLDARRALGFVANNASVRMGAKATEQVVARIPTPPPTLISASPVLSSSTAFTSYMFYSFPQLPIAGETEATTKVAPQQQPSPFNAEHKRNQALEPRRPRAPQRNRLCFPATISQKRHNHHTSPTPTNQPKTHTTGNLSQN
ncbi:hypothetical protein niasHT_024077 [Heterodera trifolii]|uniref:Uncharacterized protein n=1 Tax=Heterodera trifolii TaxID=157864 RepID=A0ABD2JYX9_9BILA